MRPLFSAPALLLLLLLLLGSAADAGAHEIRLPLEELERNKARVDRTLAYYLQNIQKTLAPVEDRSAADLSRALGGAEIELALGRRSRALEIVLGLLANPHFAASNRYCDALLMASEILESMDEGGGAMHYAALALGAAGSDAQMAEAGARWFRIARRTHRIGQRLEMFELWQSRGRPAAGLPGGQIHSELRSSVLYEVAFASRSLGRVAEARHFLAQIPSESAYGSRAAYLAGVSFVEDGDLPRAEAWFASVMDWPIPSPLAVEPQLSIEREVRSLAALAAGRLRYERGDLDGANRAYRQVESGTSQEIQACWERAFLDLERGHRRGALLRLQCVLDLGPSGGMFIDAKLFRASLLAHLTRYEDSVAAHDALHREFEVAKNRLEAGLSKVADPATFLFESMERNAVQVSEKATPGPATLFGESWSPAVDHGYRVYRGEREIRDDLDELLEDLDRLEKMLGQEDAFNILENRRLQLRKLLQEIDHLRGHAEEVSLSLPGRMASLRDSAGHDHGAEAGSIRRILADLGRTRDRVEAELGALDALEVERRTLAQRSIREIRLELVEIARLLRGIDQEAAPVLGQVAKDSIDALRKAMSDAAMRAEVGVLDAHWLKKEHRTKAIEALLQRKKETEQRVLEAIDALNQEVEESEP